MVVFDNIEFHNVAELTSDGNGAYVMHRIPCSVEDSVPDA